MFIVSRKRLISGLRELAARICAYSAPNDGLAKSCDCKYGMEFLNGKGEHTGCPEVRAAMALLTNMSEEEFSSIIHRGGQHQIIGGSLTTPTDTKRSE